MIPSSLEILNEFWLENGWQIFKIFFIKTTLGKSVSFKKSYNT